VLDVGWVVGIEVRSRSYRIKFTAKTQKREEENKEMVYREGKEVWHEGRKG
jgi:hypothetical protein